MYLRFLPALFGAVDRLYLIEEAFRSERLYIILFKVDPLVVQRLEVIFLILLPPYLRNRIQYASEF